MERLQSGGSVSSPIPRAQDERAMPIPPSRALARTSSVELAPRPSNNDPNDMEMGHTHSPRAAIPSTIDRPSRSKKSYVIAGVVGVATGVATTMGGLHIAKNADHSKQDPGTPTIEGALIMGGAALAGGGLLLLVSPWLKALKERISS